MRQNCKSIIIAINTIIKKIKKLKKKYGSQ